MKILLLPKLLLYIQCSDNKIPSDCPLQILEIKSYIVIDMQGLRKTKMLKKKDQKTTPIYFQYVFSNYVN